MTSPTACTATPGCITCGDVAVVLTVIEVSGTDANCHDDAGRYESVAIELVGDVVRRATACSYTPEWPSN